MSGDSRDYPSVKEDELYWAVLVTLELPPQLTALGLEWFGVEHPHCTLFTGGRLFGGEGPWSERAAQRLRTRRVRRGPPPLLHR